MSGNLIMMSQTQPMGSNSGSSGVHADNRLHLSGAARNMLLSKTRDGQPFQQSESGGGAGEVTAAS